MQPSLSTLVRVFARIGLLSFGGPVAQIGVMQRELVEIRGWLSESEFLKALSFAMLLPGPEAMQLCTYAGWRLRGTVGGVIAGSLFVLPGAVVMAALAWAYLAWGELPAVDAAFLGIKAAVVVVVVLALVRLVRRTLSRPVHVGLAAAAFAAITVADLPFPLVVLIAAGIGAVDGEGIRAPPAPSAGRHRLRESLATAALWGLAWWLPIAALWAAGQTRLVEIGLFFSRLAVVSFGGAYAALAYTAQEAVEGAGWLTPEQMVDGLGLAETTPGPLILVTEFVGFLAAHATGGPALGFAGAALTVWTVFLPCFLLVFTLAPHLDRLTALPRLSAALEGLSAAVLGVIAALAVYFASHVVFTRWHSPRLPDWTSLSPQAIGLTLLAALLLAVLRLPLPAALALLALAGAALGVI